MERCPRSSVCPRVSPLCSRARADQPASPASIPWRSLRWTACWRNGRPAIPSLPHPAASPGRGPLAPRYRPSADLAGIAGTQPLGGGLLTASPRELVITFDQPIVPLFMNYFDVQLERDNGDGTTTPIFDPFNAPPEGT